MQKALRLGWVLLANGLVILVTLARLRSFYSAGLLHVQIVLEFVLEVLFPIVGIIAELIDWKFARTINVGYLCAAGCFWMVGALWDHSDPFFGLLLIMSLGMFVGAGLTEIVYRTANAY